MCVHAAITSEKRCCGATQSAGKKEFVKGLWSQIWGRRKSRNVRAGTSLWGREIVFIGVSFSFGAMIFCWGRTRVQTPTEFFGRFVVVQNMIVGYRDRQSSSALRS
jgi:hypothetical protein